MTGLGLGLAIGLAIGAVGGAALVRHGMALGEKMVYGGRDGRPVLTDYEPPLMQSHTDGTEDEELET